MRSLSFRSAVVAVLLAVVAAVPVLAGPPWIAVEYPSNPHHPSTRDAAFLIRLYHHSTAISAPITGKAVGLVGGKRTSVPLSVDATSLPGVFAVRGVPKDKGAWVMVITMKESETYTASALVTLGPKGEVVNVSVPGNRTADGWTVPRSLTDADVDAQLDNAVKLAQAFESMATRPASGASVLPFLALPLGLAAAAGLRRRSRR